MIIPQTLVTISDLRYNTGKVLKKAQKEPVFVYKRKKLQGVILSTVFFKKLLQEFEDYHLSTKAKNYEKEDKSKIEWIPFEKMEKLLETE